MCCANVMRGWGCAKSLQHCYAGNVGWIDLVHRKNEMMWRNWVNKLIKAQPIKKRTIQTSCFKALISFPMVFKSWSRGIGIKLNNSLGNTLLPHSMVCTLCHKILTVSYCVFKGIGCAFGLLSECSERVGACWAIGSCGYSWWRRGAERAKLWANS